MAADRFAKPVETEQEVVDYLVSAYDVSEERAAEIVKAHASDFEAGKSRGSFIYYVGDEIANEEALEPFEIDDEEVAEEHDEDFN